MFIFVFAFDSPNLTTSPNMAVTNATTVPSPADTGNDIKMGNSWDDATWILTSSFVIFTMQSGKYIVLISKHY